jgi:hypothetical protein
MPVEQVLPLALSGAEIKKAAHDKLDQLMRGCHLNDNLAYPDGAWFKISFQFKGKDLGRIAEQEAETQQALAKDENGQIVGTDPEEYKALEAAEGAIEMNVTDPTSARIETGQPVPTRFTDKQGKDTIREVRYRRDAVLDKTR